MAWNFQAQLKSNFTDARIVTLLDIDTKIQLYRYKEIYIYTPVYIPYIAGIYIFHILYSWILVSIGVFSFFLR